MSGNGTGAVVLLGATGFLGQAIGARLQADSVTVHGFNSKTLNLTDRAAFGVLDALAGPDTTLIFASAVTPDKGRTVDALDANLQMALNVGRYVEGHPFKKVVYVSSDAVYPMSDEVVTETSAVEPADFYALAKYAGERVLANVCGAAKVPLVIVRPTGVYGAGDTHNSYGPNRFISQIISDGKLSMFGEGDDIRDHVYVDDVAAIAAALAASDATGVFNVASGESRDFGSIARQLQALSPRPFEIVNLPKSGGTSRRDFDIGKLRSALPGLTLTPFADGLKATVAARLGGVK
ncbi:MAG: NAD(P)-dependent oxidoreductase [Chloroflexi bacterium]|nr:NAD(P)-dependent oxidoreductase [Chloroflexota bacterium]